MCVSAICVAADLLHTLRLCLLIVVAFLFNWVGLVAAFCLMKSCAGRFGALTGFGLSLVKWVAIAKVCSVILLTHYRSSHVG